MSERIYDGVIFVYDRQARSDVVEAFRRAGWKPRNESGSFRYQYLSRSECSGETPRYLTHATMEEVDRLAKALEEVSREGGGGYESYLTG